MLADLSGKPRHAIEARLRICASDEKALVRAVALGEVTRKNDHWYRLVVAGQAISWRQAKTECEALGGYLACIETRREHQFLIGMTRHVKWLWLGGTDEGTEGDWRWINGSRFGYAYWAPDEPNNSSSVEHWLCMQADNGGVFNDSSNNWDEVTAYICEWD